MAKQIERSQVVGTEEMDNGVDPEALANEILIEQGFKYNETTGKWFKPKAKRVSKIQYGTDGKTNTKLLLADVMESLTDEYNRLLQVLNGKVQRSEKTLPLGAVSEGQQTWLHDQIANLEKGIFAQLNAGKRQAVSVVVPD